MNLIDQSLPDRFDKAFRRGDADHRAERKDADDHFRFILKIVSDGHGVSVFIDALRGLFKVREVQKHSLQRVSLIRQFECKLPCARVPFRFAPDFAVSVAYLAMDDSAQIDGVAVSAARADEPEFIILFGILQMAWKYRAGDDFANFVPHFYV